MKEKVKLFEGFCIELVSKHVRLFHWEVATTDCTGISLDRHIVEKMSWKQHFSHSHWAGEDDVKH